ncbi:putative Ig domain-containing protein [Piscinibacter terrae]|uniref:LysM peptidoglycan-binding domain-containing protein n=1 Tax=Piscinibacter terrae TaxID=2496871 RepID=A0A3N7J7D1_9BURK|nr:putative Ig domain-containing protein [Albitalea terrae]RQP26682.1 LysM peptidoglycan-binding domain-containing protein [Albitalea terrae]
MVAIVSGNSLGLSLTSLVTLGNQGGVGSAGQGRNGEQAYVNVANGNLVVQDQDERLVGVGLGVTALRTYNSQGRLDDDNADNWAEGIYRQQISVVGTLGAAGSQIVRTDQDGAQATYAFDASLSAYVNVNGAGAHDKITWSATQFTWTDGNTGLRQVYDATGSGRLLSTTDTTGNSLSYSYDAAGQIASIADASGETVFFDYTGSNLTQVRTAYGTGAAATTLTRVRYSYDAQNRLNGVTVDLSPTDNDVSDGKVYHTGYTYEGTSRRISTITQDDGTLLHIEYVLVGSEYRVASVADAQGHLTTYTYDTAARRTTVVDPVGQVTVFGYDADGQLIRIENAAGATQFAYGEAGHLVRVDHADGTFVTMGYDAQGNQVSQQDSAGNAVSRTYDARNQLLTETVFATAASGADAARDPLTTRHVYDAAGKNQLRFSISAEGRVTEYRYDAKGNRTASIAYGAQAYPVSGLAATAVPTESAMATWAAAQDGTAVVRSDMSYDHRGQLARSTSYASTDATGAGVLDGNQSVTQYVYDQSGALLKTVSAKAATTRFTYDGMGRVLTARDALGNTTTTTYDDVGNRTTVTLASGLVTISSFDNAGRLSSVVQSNKGVALGTTRYFYDADNRLLMTQDPTGVRSWALYDSVGRKAADIDASGHLTEYRYNASNLLTLSIGYANPVNLSLLVDGTGAPANPALAAIRPLASALDDKTWRAYDAADRLVKVVDAKGGVTQTQYDGASRVVASIDYEHTVDVSAFGDSVSPDDIQPLRGKYNRVTRNFYDRDGLLRTSIDGENYLTEFRYDAAGRLVDQVRYASRDANVSLVLTKPVADQTVQVGSALSLVLDADVFTDLADGGEISYAVSLADGSALPDWLVYDPATRTLAGTPPATASGLLSVRITATNDTGAHAVTNFAVRVNTPPAAVAIANQSAIGGGYWSFTAPAFTDADAGDNLSYSATLADGSALPSWLSFDANLRSFSGTPPLGMGSSIALRVTGTDIAGAATSATFNLVVNSLPVVVAPLVDRVVQAGSAFSASVPAASFADPDAADLLTFFATRTDGSPLPSWLSFDAATRTFSGTPTAADAGVVQVSVTAMDLAGAQVSASFSLTVNAAPVAATPITAQTARPRAQFSFKLPATAFSETAGDWLSYSATLASGAPLPSWLAFEPTVGSFSGMPQYSDAGLLSVKVTATDRFGQTAASVFTINVDTLPTTNISGLSYGLKAGKAWNYTLPASAFVDPDTTDTLSYTATLSSGAALPAWLSFNPATRSFSGTPTAASTVTVRITATDAQGGSKYADITLRVVASTGNGVPYAADPLLGSVFAPTGAAFSYTVPTGAFVDVDGDTLTYTASGMPAWMSFNATTRTFSGTPSATDLGNDAVITINAADPLGRIASAKLTVNVGDHRPQVNLGVALQVATQGLAFSYTVPAGAFSDSDAGDSLTYSATLSGGAALPAWLSFNPATRTFSGTAGATDLGTLSIDLRATDGKGLAASNVFSLRVNAAPTVPTLVAQKATVGTAWTYTSPTFPDADGDTRVYRPVGLPSWINFDPATRRFTGTPTQADAGVYTLYITSTDALGAAVTGSFTLTVNSTPMVVVPLANQSVPVGTAYRFQVPPVTFRDPDVGNTITLSAKRSTGAALPTWLSFDAATGTFSGTPPSTAAGPLVLTVTATDNFGAKVSTTFTLSVERQPVVPTAMPNQNASAGQVFNYTVPAFTELTGEPLQYRVTAGTGEPLPAWLRFDASTHTLMGIPGDADAGVLQLNVSASDPSGATSSRSFYVLVAASTQSNTLAGADQRTHNIYNARGQVVGIVDAEGYLTESIYDLDGNLQQVIRYATPVSADLDTAKTLLALRPASSPADQSTTYGYDLDNRVIQQTDTSGTVTQFVYDKVGNLTKTTVAAGTADVRMLNVRYDIQGRVTARLSAEGGALLTGTLTTAQINTIWAQYGTSYAYDAAGRLTSETDPNGLKTLYVYDGAGQLTHTINAAGEIAVRNYNSLGQLTSQVAAGKRLTAAQLAAVKGGIADAAFHAMVDPVVAAGPNSVTSYEYNVLGQVSRKVDALGADWAYAYDSFGELSQETRELTSAESTVPGQEVIQHGYDRRGLANYMDHSSPGASTGSFIGYDAFGRANYTSDGNGNQSTVTYDRLGRVIATTDPLNATRVTTYDAFSRVHTQTDATGNTTTYAYDDAARSTTVTTAEGVSVTTVRNREGQVQTVTDARGNTTTYSYDKNGALTGTATPLTTTGSSYDHAGRLTQTTDANGNKVDYTYDAANRVLTRVVDNGGLKLKTSYEYDAKGEQTAIVDPNNVRTEFKYTDGGLVFMKTVDVGGLNLATTYDYDPHGNVLKVTSPGGTVTRYVYDGLGRRKEEHVDPDGVGALNLTRSYTYDGNGNVLTSTDENGHVTHYAYDGDNRLVATIDPTGRVTGTVYDAEGRVRLSGRLAATVDVSTLGDRISPDEVAALLQFDPAHDLVELRSYDRDGRLRYTVNGGGDVTELRYDASGNVSEQIGYATKLASVNLTDASWEPVPVRDPAHDVVNRRFYDALDRAVYSVDGTGGLVQQKFDGNGNVIERTAYATRIDPNTGLTQSLLDAAAAGVADNPDNITQRYQYDKAGRLSYSVDGMGAVTHFEYDSDGNLVRRTDYATTIGAGVDPASVRVDAAHDRVTQMVYDAADRCVYTVAADGALVKRSYDNNGNVVLQSAYANKVPGGTPITLAALNGILHTDADRTTRAVFDKANRQVFSIGPDGAVSEMKYDAHGNVVQTVSYVGQLALDNTTVVTRDNSDLTTLVNAPDDGRNRHTRMAYDAANRLVFTVDATGSVKGSEYDGVGRVARSTVYARGIDPALATSAEAVHTALANAADAGPDRVDTFDYDACGYLKKHTDAMGGVEEYEYDGLGNKVKFTNKNRAVWNYEYDANGKLAREISPQVDLFTLLTLVDGTLTDGINYHESIVTAYTYDAFGNLKTRTEAQGRPGEQRTTSYSYDKLGHQVRVDYPQVAVYRASADALSTGGLAARTEYAATEVSLYTQTVYDVFGQAVANRDVSGNWSYKAYDKAGEVRYDVDAAGYVTGYTRDTFGDVTQLDRYAAATSMGSRGASAPDIAAVETVLASVSHTDDRIVTSHYDRLGRTVLVEEPQTWVYEGVTGEQGVGRMSSKATRMSYNAFGELQTQESLRTGTVASGEWVGVSHYYDALGRETATVDGLGYLTTKDYDRAGNLVAVTEFAEAAASWSVDGFTPGSTSSNDRTVHYEYDLLNRKVHEYRDGLTFGVAYGTGATEGYGRVETFYGYDAVGNLTRTTDANGGTTYSYYDALGRVTAVAAPQRSNQIDWSSVTPLTEFRRDAYGNVLLKIDYKQGAAWANDSGYAANDTSIRPEGRRTYTAYDKHGHAIQTTDAQQHTQYASYDAAGRLAKQWAGVTSTDGRTVQTSFTVTRYDALGQVVDTIQPGTVGQPVVEHQQAYNAFGEVTSRSVNGVQQEYFRYDAAGNLWQTNEGDGVDRAMLYDQQGHLTAEIRSSTVGAIRALGDASQADALGGTRRVESRYDALGRATERVEAERATNSVSGQTEVAVSNGITGSAINSTVTPTETLDGTGNPQLTWLGQNSVTMSWGSLAGLGNGLVKVEFDYLTSTKSVPVYREEGLDNWVLDGYKTVGALPRTRTAIVPGADTGATVTWDETLATAPTDIEGGISAITRVRVYKQDAAGDWQLMADNGSAAPIGRHVLVAKPADMSIGYSPSSEFESVMQLRYRKVGDTNWTSTTRYNNHVQAQVIDFGDSLYVNTSGLSAGTYEYELDSRGAADAGVTSKSSGQWLISAPPLASISSAPSFATSTSSMLRWATPTAGVHERFHIRRVGESSWSGLSIQSVGSGLSGADLYWQGDGDFEYELLFEVDGESTPYAHATGTVHITPSKPPVYVPPVGEAPAIAAPLQTGTVQVGGHIIGYDASHHPVYEVDSSGHVVGATYQPVLRWAQPAAGTVATFQVRGVADGITRTLPVVADIVDGVSRGQRVDLSSLAVGEYDTRLTFSGPAWPLSGLSAGRLVVTAGSAAPVEGRYEDRTVYVTVPVTVTPEDPSHFAVLDEYGQVSSYTAPVVVGVDYNGYWIFGEGYAGDYAGTGLDGLARYTNVHAVPFTRNETHAEVVSVWVPGHYENQTVNVTVPVTVMPEDPSHFAEYDEFGQLSGYTAPVVVGHEENLLWVFGEGYTGDFVGFNIDSMPIYENVRAVPVTHYETHTEVQSVWVPTPDAVTSSTALAYTDHTPAYTPGHTIPGVPATYSASTTTVLGSRAISEGGSNDAALTITAPRDTTERPLVKQTFDRWGNVLSVTDPRSGYWQTTYKYDWGNRVIQQNKTTPDGNTDYRESARMLYDALGNLVISIDARGNYSYRSIDQGGNVAAERQGWSNATLNAYDAYGEKVQSVDTLGNTTLYEYDDVGRLKTVKHLSTGYYGTVQAKRYTVNADNTLTQAADWTPTESNEYDELGRKFRSTNANGEVTSYTYDLQGNVVSTTSLGHTTTASFDTQNRKVSETDANGTTQTWKYDYFGRFAAGVAHTDIGGAQYSYTYNGTGELLTQTNTRGQSITNTYDGAGQLVRTQTLTRTTTYGGGEGWRDEGITGFLRTSAAAGYTALYRLMLAGGQHMLTTNAAERSSLISSGAHDEGVIGYVATAADATHVALYQLRVGGHRAYTTSWAEVLSAQASGWTLEGTIGYIGTVDDDTSTALYRLLNGETADHYYTTDRAKRNAIAGMHETDVVNTTSTTYDLAGNKLSERVEQGGVVYQDNRMAYDAQGRLRLVTGLSGLRVNYDYDRAGNRIHVRSEYQQISDDGQSVSKQVKNTWSAFDEQNREVIAEGVELPDYYSYGGGSGEYGDASTEYTERSVEDAYGNYHRVAVNHDQGHELEYDSNGNRIRDTSYGKVAVKSGGVEHFDGYLVYRRDPETGDMIMVRDGEDYHPRVIAPGDLRYDYSTGRNYVYSMSSFDGDGYSLFYVDRVDAHYTTDPVTYAEGKGIHSEFYTYDNLGRLVTTQRSETGWGDRVTTETREYDGAGRVVHEGPGVGTLNAQYVSILGDQVNFRNRVNRYDSHGQLAAQHVQDSDGHVPYDISYDLYDNAGNLQRYSLHGYGDHDYTNTYVYRIEKFDGYKEAEINGSSDTFESGHTAYSYDQNGRLTGIKDDTKPANDRSFINDVNGVVLQTVQDGKLLRNLVVNGEVIGQYGVGIDAVTPRDEDGNPRFAQIGSLDQNFRKIDGNFPVASVGSYQVQAGDTLQSIASNSYGDSSLWWKIAQANGIAGNADLRIGQTLTLPSSGISAHNDAGTFRPYDASTMMGDTTPNLPAPDGGDCGGFGALLLVVIAVAVTVITNGATAESLPEAFAALASSGAAEAGSAAAVEAAAAGGDALAAYVSASEAYLAGAQVGAQIAGGLIGATAGAVASQAVGVALHLQDKFDWGQVAQAAISGGVAGGLQGLNVFQSSPIANQVVRQAIGNAITQQVSVTMGLQKKFNWKGVVAAGAGAAVGGLVAQELNAQGEGATDQAKQDWFARVQQIGKATLTGLAAGTTTAALRGGRFSIQQVASDAFGNALGESLADLATSSDEVGPIGPMERERILGYFADGPDNPDRWWGFHDSIKKPDNLDWLTQKVPTSEAGQLDAAIDRVSRLSGVGDPLRVNGLGNHIGGDTWSQSLLWLGANGETVLRGAGIAQVGKLRPVFGAYPKGEPLPLGATTSAFMDEQNHLYYRVVAPGFNELVSAPGTVAGGGTERFPQVNITGKRASETFDEGFMNGMSEALSPMWQGVKRFASDTVDHWNYELGIRHGNPVYQTDFYKFGKQYGFTGAFVTSTLEGATAPFAVAGLGLNGAVETAVGLGQGDFGRAGRGAAQMTISGGMVAATVYGPKVMGMGPMLGRATLRGINGLLDDAVTWIGNRAEASALRSNAFANIEFEGAASVTGRGLSKPGTPYLLVEEGKAPMYVSGMTLRANEEIYGVAGATINSVDEIPALMEKAGFAASDFDEIHFQQLSQDAYDRLVEQRGGHFDAIWGDASYDATKRIKYSYEKMLTKFDGELKMPIKLRPGLLAHDEQAIYAVAHEMSEINRFMRETAASTLTGDQMYAATRAYNPLLKTNWHYQAIIDGDSAVLKFRGVSIANEVSNAK